MTENESIFGVRAALIIFISLACGLASSWLAYLIAPALPGAVLAGLGAFGLALPVLNKVIAKQL